jgi:hypothetical protein
LIFVKIRQLAKKEAIEEVVSGLLGGINSCGQVSAKDMSMTNHCE